jgi:hypothetical protein
VAGFGCPPRHENAPVTRNLVICPARTGSGDLTDAVLARPFAKLAGGTYTYFRVDGALQYIGYEEVPWGTVKDVAEYKFHPDFIHPIWSQLQQNEYSAHVTTRGDLVIADHSGLLAASRRGRWYVYDVQTFKNFFVDALGSIQQIKPRGTYRVGCNLFDVAFDLSYKRHGALLVYDPYHRVVEKVVNREALLTANPPAADSARALLRDVIGNVAMSSNSFKDRRKPLFLEVAGIDGAVVFDDKNILAFGAIIQAHPGAGQHGARTTAALSAFLWGGIPIKCSSDGDISVRFHSRGAGGVAAPAHTEFM